MKIRFTRPITADVQYLEVILQSYSMYPEDWVYCGDDNFQLTELPFYVKENDTFVLFIDLENGQILDWKEGATLEVCAKVRDEGEYWLLDKNFAKIIRSKDRYVPGMLDTRGDGYWDYIQFDVDEKGFIKNWKVNLNRFEAEWVS